MAWNSIDRLLDKTLLKLAGDRYRSFVSIYRYWILVVGDLLAEKSYPIKYDNRVLYVAVKNNTWMQELILLKVSIITKYRLEYKVEITDIVYLIRS